MPVKVDAVDIEVAQVQKITVKLDELFFTKIEIDTPDPDRNPVPAAIIVDRLAKTNADGSVVTSGKDRTRKIASVYAAAARLARRGRTKMAEAVTLLVEALQEEADDKKERDAVWEQARGDRDAANVAIADAQGATTRAAAAQQTAVAQLQAAQAVKAEVDADPKATEDARAAAALALGDATKNVAAARTKIDDAAAALEQARITQKPVTERAARARAFSDDPSNPHPDEK